MTKQIILTLEIFRENDGSNKKNYKERLESLSDKRMVFIFDGEKLTNLLEPLNLSWKERRVKELALMTDLVPHLKKIAQGREISGLSAYE
ncbi:MAG: hypothetical protein JXR48_16875 [Candidatus Delongbacteria bacterium]|nr:hypothetical protein [Candidatus Delongbacteria bacterium]MBN2836632.1 hypothetical protein [Candidatus Delongbacteria bacterium]